jgi:hypothetical protein
VVAQSRDSDGGVVCYVALVALVYNVVLIKLEAARSRRREGWTVKMGCAHGGCGVDVERVDGRADAFWKVWCFEPFCHRLLAFTLFGWSIPHLETSFMHPVSAFQGQIVSRPRYFVSSLDVIGEVSRVQMNIFIPCTLIRNRIPSVQ